MRAKNFRACFACVALIAAALVLGPRGAVKAGPTTIGSDATIRAKAGDSDIVIKATSRNAGAIDSLTWGGKEFLDAFDHGRELQTAWNSDAGAGAVQNETFNPTEAGARDDGRGAVSSSQLLTIRAVGNLLETTSHPAFWLAPGEKSGADLARNNIKRTGGVLSKRVTIGWKNLPHAIEYDVTIDLPAEEKNTSCTVEALTAYMPPEFEKFWKFDPSAPASLVPLDDGPGEQPCPIVLATADELHAMGIIAADKKAGPGVGPAYGRWRFKNEKVVKWNCVYRLSQSNVLSGEFKYRLFVAVGTAEDVRSTLEQLTAAFK